MELIVDLFRRFTSLFASEPTPSPVSAPSDRLDRRYDARQPAIEALENDAQAEGHALPSQFLQSLYGCTDPYWTTDDQRRISIFRPDGSIDPDAKAEILAAAQDGRLERQAAGVESRYLDRMGQLEGNRDALIASFEGQSGIELDPELRELLVARGQFQYRDAAGHYREVDLNASSAALVESELQELARLVTGQPVHIDVGEAGEQQAADIRRLMDADFGRRTRSS